MRCLNCGTELTTAGCVRCDAVRFVPTSTVIMTAAVPALLDALDAVERQRDEMQRAMWQARDDRDAARNTVTLVEWAATRDRERLARVEALAERLDKEAAAFHLGDTERNVAHYCVDALRAALKETP